MADRNFVNIGTKQRVVFHIPRSIRSEYPNSVFLGAGTFGIVYGLEHKSKNGNNIAVKQLIRPFENERRAQRCFRELQLLSEIDHENIIKIKFAYTTDTSIQSFDSVYFATDYCGQDLNAILAQETPEKHSFSLRSFQKIISELLRALKYLNSANVIHRDLKPDNLAINENGKLKLLDFGLARVLDENNQHTNDPGMKYYRAIETVSFGHSDRQIYNEKADIWSIGAILCEMLTGSILFKTDPPASDVPIIKALNICGPIPENVIIEQVDEERSQKYLRDKSTKAVRIDFLGYFREKARPWLKDDIVREGVSLANFIDGTLEFDHRARMSVEQSLAHPFLAQVRRPLKEVTASGTIVDVGYASISEWKQRVWGFIQNHPIR
ncbi:hypothetical protein PRIPAC_78986 [Pristionchus pacificus]|uniref:Protein kinase domain-containing protein n=1 Tax=Pristionchus pacificus TaxID=54126 RepID=A0A2A6C4K9_PRIPA|nr:hypothetical protein PRIPAC_78986 [Pristionchus pacificus]|eukprot:PDM73028.1 protein kinase [Pristionchus pacificus]